jgi:hypothetical protein
LTMIKTRLISSLASLYIWRFSTIMSRIKKKWVQNTSIKVQVSISHTPEGTNTGRARLGAAAVRSTIIKEHDASESTKCLCTTPVGSGGVTR